MKNIKNKTLNQIDNRNRLKKIFEDSITKRLVPKGLSWFICMGGLSLVAFVIQVCTGIFLVFYYVPSASEAFNSVQYIRHAVSYGWLIQKTHAVTPHFMVALILVHMLRVLFKGLYKRPCELHWMSGAALLVLTLIICYTGTFLPANSLSYGGVSTAGSGFSIQTMATNHDIYLDGPRTEVGDDAYHSGPAEDMEGEASNYGFYITYILHIIGIPLMMSIFMGFHFFMIHSTGISEPL